MKTHNISLLLLRAFFTISIFLCCALALGEDLYLDGGVSEEISYTVDGSVFVEDANLIMVEPAHILGSVFTGSGAVVDVYGGQIDVMMLVSTSENDLPEGQVTIYGTDFSVDGDPVDPNETELFLPWNLLSGTYYDGTPFSFYVSCYYAGSPGNIYTQTVKLGWVVNQPDIEVSELNCNFGQVDIGTSQAKILSVFNLGNADLTIQGLELEQSNNQFALSSSNTAVTLEPDSFTDLEILFNPTLEGVDTAVLSIASSDPEDPVLDIVLTGEGLPVILTAEDQIEEIVSIYDAAVSDGTIQGTGNKSVAGNRIDVFERTLLVVNELIQAGYDDYALEVLLALEKKCDGQEAPKDFIQGPGAEEINEQINELIESLQ